MSGAMAALAAPAKKPKPVRREPLQAKLMVGGANDRFEQEADRVASRIGSPQPIAAATPPPTISRAVVQRAASPVRSGPEEKDKPLVAPEERAQRKAKPDERKPAAAPPVRAQRKAKADDRKPPEERGVAQRREAPGAQAAAPAPAAPDKADAPAMPVGREGGEAPAAVENRIERMRKGTAPGLEPELKGKVESAVGTDLGDVRVHTDRAAAETASDLGARAFTVGHDMFFGQGEYRPGTTEGQKLIAHEAAHTVQQKGGSAAARKIQMKKKGSSKKKGKKPKVTKSVRELKGNDKTAKDKWSLIADTPVKGAKGELTVPELKLPTVLDVIKGGANPKTGLAARPGLPAESSPFAVNPQPLRKDRDLEGAYEVWLEHIRKQDLKPIGDAITALTKKKNVGHLKDDDGKDVFVLKRAAGKRETEDVLVVGTIDNLAKHDSLLRPMIAQVGGGTRKMEADHILEDQLGGPNTADNLWLLEQKTNSKIGNQIKDHVDTQISETLERMEEEQDAQLDLGVDYEGSLPADVQAVKRNYVLNFATVTACKPATAVKDFWTREDITEAKQVKWYKALTEEELFAEGFKFDPKKPPKRINLFPAADGGRPIPFKVNKKGDNLDIPPYFFRGIHIDEIEYYVGWLNVPGSKICRIKVDYQKKKDPGDKKSQLVHAQGWVDVKHDVKLGFGGYITRDSIRSSFTDADFTPLCPLTFSEAGISPEGELVAKGSALSELALFPQLNVPMVLKGDEISLNFPVPSDKLSLGPVALVDPAISLGVDGDGFFIAGSTGVAIEGVGEGSLLAKRTKKDTVIAGEFNFDLDFLDPASIAVSYSLEKDDFFAKATLGFVKGALPGVKAGKVEVTATRETFGFIGSLDLAGPLDGSQILVEYKPETGLVIAGKDLPLPVEKLPGVTDAKVSVIVRRLAETGEWKVSGGGKAAFEKGGAKGSLDILFDGEAVDFTGRVDLAKGPATGWIQISASNRAVDEEGKPKEGAPVGPFQIWGKGEATVLFGKYLKGTVGIDYTRDGRVILAGEVAMAQSFDLFPKKDLSPKDPLFDKETPDFPIWGVKLGPVGIGIFAFGYASIKGIAYVGPGQLKDARLGVTNLDLDQPELATITGGAKFAVDAYAGLSVSIGGGLKAQVANAYAKGKLGLYGDLGLLLTGSFDVTVNWNHADGFAVGADARIEASPKFEFGVEGSLTVGVDLLLTEIEETWGPWRKPLGKFGPDMPFVMDFPIKWSEKDGLQLDVDDLKPPEPQISAKDMMGDAFDTLV
ncbi:MAG: eCIS core domain-containing protein [Allosphingosinicella sp.]